MGRLTALLKSHTSFEGGLYKDRYICRCGGYHAKTKSELRLKEGYINV
jgi:hypothetical protein